MEGRKERRRKGYEGNLKRNTSGKRRERMEEDSEDERRRRKKGRM